MADEADEYSCVSRGKLNLKGDSGVSKKRKKNKDKKLAAQAGQVAESEVKQSVTESKRTPAEQAFQKMHDKMQKERIAQKAAMTHKQRVEKFNQHLDSLTEHFDIPKVSWTK